MVKAGYWQKHKKQTELHVVVFNLRQWESKRWNCTCRAGSTEYARAHQQTPSAHFWSTSSTASKDVTMNIMMGNQQPTMWPSDRVFLALCQHWTVESHHSYTTSNAGIEDVFKAINVFTRIKCIFCFWCVFASQIFYISFTFKVVLKKSYIVLTCLRSYL